MNFLWVRAAFPLLPWRFKGAVKAALMKKEIFIRKNFEAVLASSIVRLRKHNREMKMALIIIALFPSSFSLFTFSRSPSLTLALTRPATRAISRRSGELVSALVRRRSPVGREVLKRKTSSSVCVLIPWLPPVQMVKCCDPLKASVADSRPHVGPV